MAPFKTLRDRAYRDTFLSELIHGEKVLLIRNYGRAEDITAAQALIAAAILAQSYMTVSISDVDEDPIVDDGAFTREEEIIVQCCRDPAAQNSDGQALGGISDPNIHDAILRDVSRDSLQVPYLYKHELKDSSEVLWRLIFRRSLQGIQRVAS
jgi:hypothetical protein